MKHLLKAFLLSLPLLTNAADLNLPLLPAEAKIIQGIAATEGVEVVLGSKPGFSVRGAAETLVNLGVPKDGIASVTVQSKEREALAFTVTHDKAGHVLAITGNGPWLRNSTLRSFKALPELRIIRMDHNGFVGKDPRIPEFDGSGFDALTDSKLADIKIGLSFSDKGMEQCAKIKTLRSFSVAHSQATGAGIGHFAGHPGLTSFSISEMAKPSVTEKALGAIAKIPNLTRVGLGECYVTYDGGFALLAPFKGKLTEINLSMCVAAQADLDKLKADHPQAKIITTPVAAGLKALGRLCPFMDLARVGIWGWSGGGSNTLNAMFRKPDMYHVGIAVVPKPQADFYNAWYQEIFMRTPKENPEGYRTCSPITYAEGLRGDLLIITGSGETNTHVELTEALVDRLIALGKRFDYFVYPNRDHGLSEGKGSTVHVRMLIARYLIEHLPPGPR